MGLDLTKVVPSLASWSTISFPMIPVALTFWIVIMCGVHALKWTMVVMRSLIGWWCCVDGC